MLRPQQRGSLVSRIFKNSSVAPENLHQEDVIIVVMGPTGSGKSTFIETITGVRGIVGHTLESFTTKISVYKISFPEAPGSDIHFVDTPGFDDTTKSDVDIFKMISDWLHYTYRRKIQVTGLLYFHRISDNRMAGTALKNLQLFESLCGEEFNNIVLATTMWDEIEERFGYYRERELKNSYWRAMIARGSGMRRFLRTRESAFEILEPILEEVRKRRTLLLQREVEDLGLRLNQTRAGQTLSMQLDDLVGVHEEKLNKIRTELRDPSLTPDELRLLMEDYQRISIQIQDTTQEMKRMKNLTTKPTKLKQIFGNVFRAMTPRPQSRATATPIIQEDQGRLPPDLIVYEGTSGAKISGASRQARAQQRRLPMSVMEEPPPTPPSRQGTPRSSHRPRTSSHLNNNRDAGSYPSTFQPENMKPSPSSPSPPPSARPSRSQSMRSDVPSHYRPLNEIPPNWGQFLPQQALPPRSHTVQPASYPSSSSSRSRRASTPHNSGMVSYQGSSSQDFWAAEPNRRGSGSLSRSDDFHSQSSEDVPPVPPFPWSPY